MNKIGRWIQHHCWYYHQRKDFVLPLSILAGLVAVLVVTGLVTS